jgi:hypothetical protein
MISAVWGRAPPENEPAAPLELAANPPELSHDLLSVMNTRGLLVSWEKAPVASNNGQTSNNVIIPLFISFLSFPLDVHYKEGVP